jgi:hypothetical protein
VPVGLAPKLVYEAALDSSQAEVLNQFYMRIKGLEARIIASHSMEFLRSGGPAMRGHTQEELELGAGWWMLKGRQATEVGRRFQWCG